MFWNESDLLKVLMLLDLKFIGVRVLICHIVVWFRGLEIIFTLASGFFVYFFFY